MNLIDLNTHPKDIYYSNKYKQRTIITEAQYILSDLVNVMKNEKIETLDNLSDAKIIDLIGKTGI